MGWKIATIVLLVVVAICVPLIVNLAQEQRQLRHRIRRDRRRFYEHVQSDIQSCLGQMCRIYRRMRGYGPVGEKSLLQECVLELYAESLRLYHGVVGFENAGISDAIPISVDQARNIRDYFLLYSQNGLRDVVAHGYASFGAVMQEIQRVTQEAQSLVESELEAAPNAQSSDQKPSPEAEQAQAPLESTAHQQG